MMYVADAYYPKESPYQIWTQYDKVRQSKVWPLLNFHELQTEEFPHFSLLSKNPLKLNKSKMNQIILIILCRNGGNTSPHQLSSENQYNYTPLVKLFTRSSQLGIK